MSREDKVTRICNIHKHHVMENAEYDKEEPTV